MDTAEAPSIRLDKQLIGHVAILVDDTHALPIHGHLHAAAPIQPLLHNGVQKVRV